MPENPERRRINRRKFLKQTGAATFLGAVSLSGAAAAKDAPVKVLTPSTTEYPGIDKATVELHADGHIDYVLGGEGLETDSDGFVIRLNNANDSDGNYTPQRATAVLQQDFAKNANPGRSQNKIKQSGSEGANENDRKQGASTSNVSALSTNQAGAYCLIHDPPHYDLCRTKHTLDFTCGGSGADFESRWYEATVWCPTKGDTCWKHDWNRFEYLHDYTTVESEVEAQYYNDDWSWNHNRTWVWTEVYLKGRPDCSWRWEVRWKAWGEDASWLHAHFGAL